MLPLLPPPADITETVYDGMRPLSEKEGKTAIDAWTAFMEDLKKTQEKKPEPPPDVPMSKFLEVFLKEFGVSAQYQPGGGQEQGAALLGAARVPRLPPLLPQLEPAL